MDPIYTYYEGGDFLEKVFEVIQHFLYGDAVTVLDQSFTALLRIALTVGAFCCISIAFFRQSFKPI